jgi:DUF971 family protein
MATEILYSLSTNELEKEIKKLLADDQRSLPHRSKVFSAVAKIQKFDVLPEVVELEQLNHEIAKGCIELNRGVSSTKGVPSQFYAMELVRGSLYPGTLSALGNGIYFAAPSMKDETFLPNFPLVSKVALKYTKGENSGTLIRAALKSASKVADCDDLKQDLRENRNRARAAGITDIGTYAAALGFDAYYADGIYDDADERIYTVLNRGSLLIQKTAKLIKSN